MQKILIADDHARMRQELRQGVIGLASTLFEISEGGEATALYATERPDCVLIDSTDQKQQINPLKAQTRNTTMERQTNYAKDH